LYKLHDSKYSCEGKEIYMRFDFVSRNVVQAKPTHSEYFLEYIFSKPHLFSKDLIFGGVNWWWLLNMLKMEISNHIRQAKNWLSIYVWVFEWTLCLRKGNWNWKYTESK